SVGSARRVSRASCNSARVRGASSSAPALEASTRPSMNAQRSILALSYSNGHAGHHLLTELAISLAEPSDPGQPVHQTVHREPGPTLGAAAGRCPLVGDSSTLLSPRETRGCGVRQAGNPGLQCRWQGGCTGPGRAKTARPCGPKPLGRGRWLLVFFVRSWSRARWL